MLPLFLCEVNMEEGTYQTSVTCTKYTDGQYGCSVTGKSATPREMDFTREIETMKPDCKSRKAKFVNDFIILKRENV